MPWLRGGDNAATHPIVMRVFALVRDVATRVLERDVAVNEVFGFVVRCAMQSAGHVTDYVIDEGTAHMMGGARTERLLQLACQAGYLKAAKRRGERIWRLIEVPEFIHMRKAAELERDRQRKHDNANRTVTAPVRYRDGDECRYCGVIVNWLDRKSGRGGTYDHRDGLDQPATVESLVVACQACNGGRGDDPDADQRYPLRPAPDRPYYSTTTAAFLLNAGYRVAPTDDLRPGTQPGHAHSDPAPGGTTRTPPITGRAPVTKPRRGTGETRGKTSRETARASPATARSPRTTRGVGPPDLQIPADTEHPESGFAGTGRDGTGSATGSGATRPYSVPRRARRSRRGKTTRPRNDGEA